MARPADASPRLALLALILAGVAGCQLGAPKLIPSPQSYDEQVAEIVKIVPLGTERSEAVRRLETAGITGSFGISQSIYYCNLWRREGGKRWQLDVALLFNEDGRLYGTRHGDTETAIEKTAGTHSANEPTARGQAGGSNSAAATVPTTPGGPSSPRSGPRSPIREEP